jgi:ribosomal protein S18 acetylase RimI-like enzyme
MNAISLRDATLDDLEWLYALHRAAMKSYVEQTWGWEEQWQVQYFRQHFDASTRQVIQHNGQDIGFIDVEERENHMLLANIEILPSYQRRGIGTFLIQDLLGKAAIRGLYVSLQVLKVSPAKALYERLGFELTGETDTHYLMKRVQPGDRRDSR